jgi:hypothetical protein
MAAALSPNSKAMSATVALATLSAQPGLISTAMTPP